jgi:hypothetical protein
MHASRRAAVGAALAIVTATGVGTSFASGVDTNSVNNVYPTGHFTGVVVDGHLQVVASCAAVATGAVASTSVDDCYLSSGGASHRRALPGPTSVVVFTQDAPIAPLRLCWVVSAKFTNTSTVKKSRSGCSAYKSPGGGGKLLIG